MRKTKGEADAANREMWRLINADNWEAIQQRLAAGDWPPNRPLVLALQPGGSLLLSLVDVVAGLAHSRVRYSAAGGALALPFLRFGRSAEPLGEAAGPFLPSR